ncbi:phage late control D family protein [Spartinivicinus poritis]|uniref:Contractile injection system protein, VgrG/Pvc8 family n=1 Tax=Spartinivicinus poritis TaxID=2994640 RepID=A0ABT5UAG4_9GAMM|nr:contractile injection system protein, VgrG/Pvc8 family [Spartinivicinus sp. A2-2]MDE1463373.1 contractile injection system protein, VgrG/Pvc8 family [Spartinivicinus sp. A2-2]
MAIKPVYTLLADNENITKVIYNRLLDITITDNAGWESDSLEVTLDDTGHAIALPDTGAKLEIYLGYKEKELELMGAYTVDEIELASPPNTLKITGKAANMGSSLKSPKTITWSEKGGAQSKANQVNLETIFSKIAKDNGLKIKIDKKYKNKKFAILNQRNESDINFLTRLATSVGGVLKITDDTLSLKPRIPETGVIELIPQDVTQWRVNITKRTSYNSVTANYYDKKRGKKFKVTVDKSKKGKQTKPARQIRTDAISEVAATALAIAELENAALGEKQLTITLPGNTTIKAERQLKLIGFRAGANGLWIIDTVKHQLNNSGYITEITASSIN